MSEDVGFESRSPISVQFTKQMARNNDPQQIAREIWDEWQGTPELNSVFQHVLKDSRSQESQPKPGVSTPPVERNTLSSSEYSGPEVTVRDTGSFILERRALQLCLNNLEQIWNSDVPTKEKWLKLEQEINKAAEFVSSSQNKATLEQLRALHLVHELLAALDDGDMVQPLCQRIEQSIKQFNHYDKGAILPSAGWLLAYFIFEYSTVFFEADESKRVVLMKGVQANIKLLMAQHKDCLEYITAAKKWHILALLEWGNALLCSLSSVFPTSIYATCKEALSIVNTALSLTDEVLRTRISSPSGYDDLKKDGVFYEPWFVIDNWQLWIVVIMLHVRCVCLLSGMPSITSNRRWKELDRAKKLLEELQVPLPGHQSPHHHALETVSLLQTRMRSDTDAINVLKQLLQEHHCQHTLYKGNILVEMSVREPDSKMAEKYYGQAMELYASYGDKFIFFNDDSRELKAWTTLHSVVASIKFHNRFPHRTDISRVVLRSLANVNFEAIQRRTTMARLQWWQEAISLLVPVYALHAKGPTPKAVLTLKAYRGEEEWFVFDDDEHGEFDSSDDSFYEGEGHSVGDADSDVDGVDVDGADVDGDAANGDVPNGDAANAGNARNGNGNGNGTD